VPRVEYLYISGKSAEEFGLWCASNGRPPGGALPIWHWDKAFEESCAFLGV
jgi:hypothetical protein